MSLSKAAIAKEINKLTGNIKAKFGLRDRQIAKILSRFREWIGDTKKPFHTHLADLWEKINDGVITRKMFLKSDFATPDP